MNWELRESELPGIVPRIAYYDSTGREIDGSSIFRTQGPVHWTLRDEDLVPHEAVQLWSQGREAGTAGDFARAMELFRAAHALAPPWARPVYEGAWTALLMGDPELAEQLYGWTDRMVPQGYWTAKTAVDCLARERSGEFPRGLYQWYVRLEGESDPGLRAEGLERIVKECPTFAPAWKSLAVLRESDAGREEAIRRGLEARPDAETHGFLTLNRAEWLERHGQSAAAASLRQETLENKSTTLQVAALIQLILKHR